MAGHYFYDPRPFYGHNGNNGLIPMDELFYGRYEPVPYWMDQRMAPVPAFDDYYPGEKQAAMARGLPQLQQYAYKRPESRDDIGVDMYKRSPYNFNGVAVPMPSYGGQQQRQSQDDTWVHAMSPYGPAQQHGNMPRTGNDQYRQMPQMEVPMGYNNMPTGNMNGNRGMEMPVNHGHMSNKGSTMGHSGSNMSNMNNMGNNGNNGNTGSRMMSNMGNNGSSMGSMGNMGNNGSNHGNQGSKQMSGSGNQFGNKSSSGYGNGYNNNGYENVKSSSQGGKSMNSKMQGSKTSQRYGGDDSSSEDSDDEYENRNNYGMKWATKGSSVKHGNGHQNFVQKGTGSNGSHSHAYDSISSQHKKSGGHHGGSKSGGSMLSKMLRFGGDSSSSDSEDEGYGHGKSKNSRGSSMMGGLHGSHGSLQSYGHPQLQSKQMPYGSSQSNGVELKVPICCDNCERKVRDCLKYMAGVENVLCDQWNRKVIVYGNVKADSVLKRVRKVKKGSELWQQWKQQQQLRVY